MVVSEAVIKEFNENGVVCLRNAFSPLWIKKAAEGIELNINSPSPNGEYLRDDERTGVYFNDNNNWKRIPQFEEFVYHSPAAQIAGLIMQSKFSVFYHEHVLCKEAGTTKKTPWHQDQPYYPWDGFKNCSIWLPIDDVPKATCLQFVKGSHRLGRRFIPRKFATHFNYQIINDGAVEFFDVPNIDADKDRYEILSWDLQSGDCLVFHMLTLHGAAGNFSITTPRRALATRWLGDDVVFAARPWTVSPDFDYNLNPGDPPFLSPLFPIAWTK